MVPNWIYIKSQAGAGGAGPPAFPAQQVSIDQSTGSEAMAKSTNVSIGIANAWTLSYWLNPNAGEPAQAQKITQIRPASGGANIVQVERLISPSHEFRVFNQASGGGNIKFFVYANFMVTDTWSFIVITWNGTDIVLYHQASVVTPTAKTIDNSGTMSSTNRRIGIGSDRNGSTGTSFDGKLHSSAIWDVVLDADAVTELYNSGAGEEIDYASDGTNYTSSADLLHWWRLGFDSGDIGKDYGTHSTLIDILDDATGITSDDIVSDYPGL